MTGALKFYKISHVTFSKREKELKWYLVINLFWQSFTLKFEFKYNFDKYLSNVNNQVGVDFSTVFKKLSKFT